MAKIFNFIIIILIVELIPLNAITIIHHDKPEYSQISKMVTKMSENSVKFPTNDTIIDSVIERQKRLLPYVNYYIDNNHQQYQVESSKNINNNYEELTNNENKQKFTPFLESNAIPGHFLPMIRNQPKNNKDKIEYTTNKLPNYSAIYDKLSQLKLSTQHIRLPPTYLRNYQTNLKPQKLQINYIPSRYVNTQYNNNNNIQPSKTIFQTYTATNIDIPTGSSNIREEDERNTYSQNYQESITANYQQKPYIQHHIAIEIPQNSYHYSNERKPINSQTNHDLQQPSPLIYITEKPVTEKEYIELIPIKKPPPIIYIQRKPSYQRKPPQIYTIVEDELQHQKFIPIQSANQNQYIDEQLEKYISPAKQFEPQRYQPNLSNTKYQTTTSNYQPTKYYQQPITTTENINSLSYILKQLQDTNMLPQTLTPDNIDNSIKTLVKILTNLKAQQQHQQEEEQTFSTSKPIIVPDDNLETDQDIAEKIPGTVIQSFPVNTVEGGTPGKPGIDYPALSTIPQTTFNCKTQRYKGFFGDPDTNCQVWHYCDLNGGQASFLCPNGTIFSQVALTCDWWYNVKCSTTPQLYVLNERLYKYILPLSPKFPEDYSGPLVDKYLALKFKEMEEKIKKNKKNKSQNENEEDLKKETEEYSSKENSEEQETK